MILRLLLVVGVLNLIGGGWYLYETLFGPISWVTNRRHADGSAGCMAFLVILDAIVCAILIVIWILAGRIFAF